MSRAILLISSPDRKGLVSAISTFLFQFGANIVDADQHQDRQLNQFFMRLDWDLSDFTLDEPRFRKEFQVLADNLDLDWTLSFAPPPPRVAIFVSHYLHCLVDLLHRRQIGEIRCDIPLIIGNHDQARELADYYKIAFTYLPTSDMDRAQVEQQQLALLSENRIDLVVLARYMQILSPQFVGEWRGRVINVHHSFLPAFSGAKPYHAALRRGVKLIGATAHYVTERLDDGPIIEQEVMRVSHRDQLEDLVQKGRDLERLVLSRAVRWHLEQRILRYANRTVIFD